MEFTLLNSYSSTPPGEFRRGRFCASPQFLRGLEKRHNFPMRKPGAEKRATIDAYYATYFRERINTLPEVYLRELVLNTDETWWHLYEALRRVLEEKGKEIVKLRSHESEKSSFIAFGGITFSADKVPLWLVVKEKTKRSETKFGSHPGIIIKQAEVREATASLVVEYRQWLHGEIAGVSLVR
jgi:hypothetical protein